MKRFTALVAAMLLAVMTYAQPIVTSVGNLTSCTDTVVVPIDVVKVTNVGAISLVLEYNTTVLTYFGSQNQHPSLAGGLSSVINQVGNKVYFSWHAVSPLNILQGTLFELVFLSTGGYSAFTWDVTTQAACEYSDVNANVLPATFVNGSVTVVPDPAITGDPMNVRIEEGQSASFSITATNATAYQWQESTDQGVTWADVPNGAPYIGADQATLQIINTPVTYNQNQYRCVASGLCQPAATSAAATLTVDPIITTYIGSHTFCADEIVVPVYVEHFYGVAGVSLTLGYNTVVLNYTGVVSSNPLLASGNFIDNSVLGKVFISWFSLAPVDLGDDLLLELGFTSASPGTSALVWDLNTSGNCEYNNVQSDNITSVFNNGSVTVLATPAIYFVNGGGEYCAGDQGVMVGLTGSQVGVNYELYLDGSYVKTVAGTGSALSFGYQTAAGSYTVYAQNVSTGCDSDMIGSVNVSINPVPSADAGADQIMLLNTSAQLDGAGTGGTGTLSYLWTPGGMTTEDVTVTPTTTTTYTLKVTDSKGCFDTDDATVTVYLNTVNGYVTYNNNNGTPMQGVTVYMQPTGVKTVMSDVTDANGYYEFPAVANGTYDIWAEHNGTWGGVNSTDALVIMEHFVKIHVITDALTLLAADVDGSSFINTSDAFQTAQRFAQIITSFGAGDWVLESAQVSLNLDDYVTVNLKGQCVGDANRSYIPGLKSANNINLSTAGTLNAGGKAIEIPLRAENAMQAGAVSLVMDMPKGLDVTKVLVGNDEALFNQDGNRLSVSWYSTQALSLNAGDVLMRIAGNVDGDLTYDAFQVIEGEIADDRANVIFNAGITMPKLVRLASELSLSNQPNPFSNTTSIRYSIPQDGNVTLRVYNLLGEEVAQPVNAFRSAGNYEYVLDGSSLEPGIYHYRLELNGESTTRSMIRIK